MKTSETTPVKIKSPSPCPYCGGGNTRLDYDYPETMSDCDNCGCDFITDSGEIILDPSLI